MKKYKIVNKSRFFVFIVFVVYVYISMFSMFNSFGRAEYISSDINYEEVYVETGDTIWSIATSHNYIESDPRDIVAEIRSFNNLNDVVIKPGDIIKIPLIKK